MDREIRRHLFAVLRRLNPWWVGQGFDSGVPRELIPAVERWMDRDLAVVLLGMRRVGKTTLMRQLIGRLLGSGVPPRDILFVNFDEAVFAQHAGDPEFLEELFNTFVEFSQPEQTPYLFLDEVQALDHWARWIRGVVDSGRARVVITGSTSHVLSQEVSTLLTGRCIERLVGPFSFRESLTAQGELPDLAQLALASAPRMNGLLRRYLEHGGLPKPMLDDDRQMAGELLRQYFGDIINRDVIARHGLRAGRNLEVLALHLMDTTAARFTFNKLSKHYSLPLEQVRQFVHFLTEAYVVAEVREFSFKPNSRLRAPRKAYASDVGMRNATCFRFAEDIGRLAETVVYSTLALEPDSEVFYFAEKGECDFVRWTGARAAEVVQVCFGPDPLPDRELRGLVEAMNALELLEGVIVTDQIEQTLRIGDQVVKYVPLWRWLLERPFPGDPR